LNLTTVHPQVYGVVRPEFEYRYNQTQESSTLPPPCQWSHGRNVSTASDMHVDGSVDHSGRKPLYDRLTITSKGFQFLLEDRQAQLWQILMYYLTAMDAKKQSSATVLSLFFSLGCMQLGQVSETRHRLMAGLLCIAVIPLCPSYTGGPRIVRVCTQAEKDRWDQVGSILSYAPGYCSVRWRYLGIHYSVGG
jgi:hypothetical protein